MSGGQADGTVINATSALPVLDKGDAKLVGFIGDEVPWQVGAVYTAAKTADQRRKTVEGFLRAYRMGARDYHDAFADANGRRADGASADAILAILAKYTGRTPAQLRRAISYVDSDARLDVKDVLHQVAWFHDQGMLKGTFDPAAIIDRRYVTPLP